MTSFLFRQFACASLLVALSLSTVFADEPVRERMLFDNDWKFIKDDPADAAGQLSYGKVKDEVKKMAPDLQAPAKAEEPLPEPITGKVGESVSYVQSGFDDSTWRSLNLPHDWGIEGPFKQEYFGATGKLPYWGVGWYRKHFPVAKDQEGKRIFLDIDGAMAYSMVWINGHFVGGWPYGYTSYQVELTPWLNYGGENVIAVRLDNPNKSSRWYPGGGIYRHVWLESVSPVHVARNGTFITTPDITPASAKVDLKVSVDNQGSAPAEVSLTTQVYDLLPDDTHGATAVAEAASVNLTIVPGTRQIGDTNFAVTQPKLWSLTDPHRYVVVTTVTQDGRVVDRYETPFGIRTLKFDAEKGFFLNGERVVLNGVCNHADLGALGIALNDRALERQIEIMKEMGCNAIRTSHNPPAPELLTLCDKLGLLVMDESFDCWGAGKNDNDYHTVFWDWHNRDMRAQIRRDRNHPSVIMWSTGNEISEQGWGQKLSQELTELVHSEDVSRPTTAACNYTEAGTNGFQKTVDVFGYNYKPWAYEKFHQMNPTIPLYGSETASTISSRGEYFFSPQGDYTNFQVNSYVLSAPGWASPPDPELKQEAKHPYVFGQFLWTGFDYLGEPTPYNSDITNLSNVKDPVEKARLAEELARLGKIAVPSRSSYFGAVDLAGFKKDLFYFMQAAWRPELKMVHILPHWNWPERVGQVTPVFVFTSGDEVELFLNGQSLGKKQRGDEFRLRWNDVKYAPGELKAVAYKGGQVWAEETVKTTGEPAKLQLAADHPTIKADGRDLCFITASVVDKDGLVVPRTSNLMKFEISGPGEIIVTDNGDATSLLPFQSSERKAFNGLALVIVRPIAGKPGDIVIKATSEGLAPAEVAVKSQ